MYASICAVLLVGGAYGHLVCHSRNEPISSLHVTVSNDTAALVIYDQAYLCCVSRLPDRY